MFANLFAVIAPVVICVIIGWTWKKKGYDYDANFVSRVVTNIGAPCLAFSTLVQSGMESDAFFRMAAACVVTMVFFAMIYALFLKIGGYSQRAFLPALTFANTGNIGLPLCLFAFGDEGLAMAIAYFTVNAVILFTGGVAISAGTSSLKGVLKLPILYGVVAAFVFTLSDTAVPVWVGGTASLVGGMMIPLMLITLGVSLADLKVASLPRSTLMSVMRLAVGFGVGVATANLFGMEQVERGVLIIQCAMPVAVFNYLIALRYDNEPAEVAGTVVISTALSFATLPLLMAYVM